MNTITLTDLKKHGSQSISDTQTQILIVNSKPKSAIVPIEDYQMLLDALEELQDKQDIIKRQNEPSMDADTFFKKAAK